MTQLRSQEIAALQELLDKRGIPAEANKMRAVPRVLFSYCGKKKKQFLALKISMIVNRVLPDHGQVRRYFRSHTHDELAEATGLDSRATFTRWMAHFSRDRKTGQGADVPLIHRRRRFAQPNIYSSALPEHEGTEWIVSRISTRKAVPGARYRSEKKAHEDCNARNREAGGIEYQVIGKALDPDKFHYASAEVISELEKELLDDIATGTNAQLSKAAVKALMLSPVFSAALACELRLNGFGKVPEWVWHPNLGISYIARLVLTYYICCGILDKGWVQVHQRKVALALGISIKTLFRVECELESVGLLRVVGQKRGTSPENKTWLPYDPDWRTINKILFLPIRKMTDAEIQAERRRMVEARRALHALRKISRQRLRKLQISDARRAELAQKRFTLSLYACRAARIAREVVRSYEGLTARMNEIWAAIQQKLLQAGIERKLILTLIPNILAPPGLSLRPPEQDDYQKAAEIRRIIEGSLRKIGR